MKKKNDRILIERIAIIFLCAFFFFAYYSVFAIATSDDSGSGDTIIDQSNTEEVSANTQEGEQIVSDVETEDSDVLLMQFLGNEVSKDLGTDPPASGAKKGARTKYGEKKLSGPALNLYYALRAQIEKAAAGESESAAFTITFGEVFEKLSYTKEELGVDELTTEVDGQPVIKKDAKKAFEAKFEEYRNDDVVLSVLGALLMDCPYELYWYDKEIGIEPDYPAYSYSSGRYEESNEEVLYIEEDETAFVLGFTVSADYKPDGVMDTTDIDTSKTQAAAAYVENTAEIIAENENKNDLKKLESYKNAICDAVDYNEEAAKDEDMPYGDPWQMIWVFDDDKSTEVVCEGYSKAFQFLCDNSSFDSDEIETYSVSGIMGKARHMWNIVHMDEEDNYLVDVTNSDDGTIGCPDMLFLKGALDGGNVNDGYSFDVNRDNKADISYCYDIETRGRFSDDELSISSLDYAPSISAVPIDISEVSVSGITNKTFSGKAQTQNPVLKIDVEDGTYILEEGEDYSLSYKNNINAGTATLVIDGKGYFAGRITRTFKINAKAITPAVTLSKTSFVYNGKNQKPTVTVKYGSSKLASDQYTITWPKNQKNVGPHSITVTLKSNYSGKKAVSYSILPKGTKLGKITAAKKGFTVKWSKQSTKMSAARITGYQVQYSTNKNFKSGNKSVKIKGYGKTSKKIGKLKAKKYYYVRVRTYSVVGGKTYYSGWSAAKRVKTK